MTKCSSCGAEFKLSHPHNNLCGECGKLTKELRASLSPNAIQNVFENLTEDARRELATAIVMTTTTHIAVVKAFEASMLNLDTGEAAGSILLSVNMEFFNRVLHPALGMMFNEIRKQQTEGEEWKEGGSSNT